MRLQRTIRSLSSLACCLLREQSLYRRRQSRWAHCGCRLHRLLLLSGLRNIRASSADYVFGLAHRESFPRLWLQVAANLRAGLHLGLLVLRGGLHRVPFTVV
jgi:hypothetical protein